VEVCVSPATMSVGNLFHNRAPAVAKARLQQLRLGSIFLHTKKYTKLLRARNWKALYHDSILFKLYVKITD